MLERSRRAPDTSAPDIRSAMRTSEHDAAIAEIAGRLTNDADAQAEFMATARSAPAYLAARERSKLHCTLITEEVRVPLRELGWRLVKRGLLARWEDVLLVNDDEAAAFVANPSAYTSVIGERAARLEMLKAKEPPFVFEGEPPPLSSYKDRNSGEAALVGTGTRLTGIGISPGRYTGPARVITSLSEQSTLEPGEVIVAAITDASWGPCSWRLAPWSLKPGR
jgi:pyruvate,water dikinase